MTFLDSIDGVWLILIASAVGLIGTVALGKLLLPLLARFKCGQTERDDGPQTHLKKSGTPTMGGLMFIAAIVVACLLCATGSPEFVVTAILMTLGYGLIGFLDDYIKVIKKRSLGLNARQKLAAQTGLALVLAIYAYKSDMVGSALYVPFAKTYADFGWFYIPFVVFAVLATTNSVNLTDGLDGLASGVDMVVMATMAVILTSLYTAVSRAGASAMLGENTRNLAVFAAATAGACIGFLYYNRYPARVFMGDTGSMALGAAFVTVMVLSRMILLIPILGFAFMMSSVSDIIQVVYFKVTHGKRVFLMAPLHHHFEKMGVPEVRITGGYILATVLLAAVTLFII